MVFRFTLLFIFVLTLTGCNLASDKELDDIGVEENVYAKYHVEKMMQYTNDLAFIEPNNIGRLLQITTFNKKGQEIKIVRFDKSGNICFTEDINPIVEQGKNKVDELEILDDSITVTTLNPEGKPIDKISHTYNDEKQIISTIRIDKDGVLAEKMTFEYYSNGLIKKDIYWNVDLNKPEQIITYQYEYFK